MCVIPRLAMRCQVCQTRIKTVNGYARRCEKYEGTYKCDNVSYYTTTYWTGDTECPECIEIKKQLAEANNKKY